MTRKSCAGRASSLLRGTSEAKRLAAAILEGLSGLRGPQEISEALKISMTRYYHLETRALQGLVEALEPRPRGRQHNPQTDMVKMARDNARLERELKRAQALVRSAQRTIGLLPARKSKLGTDGKKARRTRRAMVRAEKAVEALRQPPVAAPSVQEV
jgi:hypothetical protein